MKKWYVFKNVAKPPVSSEASPWHLESPRRIAKSVIQYSIIRCWNVPLGALLLATRYSTASYQRPFDSWHCTWRM